MMKKCILTWLCFTAITLNGLTYNIVCHNGGTYLIANHYNNPINNSLTYVFAGVPDFSTVPAGNSKIECAVRQADSRHAGTACRTFRTFRFLSR